jgi:octaprenyl-diphosphate synthase
MEQLLSLIGDEMARIEERLDRALQAEVDLVHEVSRYLATVRGKRLRPALAVICARASDSWHDGIVDGAVAIEMIHSATMIHDDVVDVAAQRRGQPTVNANWDDRIAVLMGDFLLARALNILVGLQNLPALGSVSHATERLSQGEIFEIQIGLRTDTSESSYLSMVGDKTASLITASCTLGPLLAAADEHIVKAMETYGENLGLAFQIADDLLDFTSDVATLGKPVGHDLREGKLTLPLIKALEAAPAPQRQDMEALLRRDDKQEAEWAQIVTFVKSHGGLEAAEADARTYAGRARACLEVLAPSPWRAALDKAVKLVVDRKN